jgi:hypothetical protein
MGIPADPGRDHARFLPPEYQRWVPSASISCTIAARTIYIHLQQLAEEIGRMEVGLTDDSEIDKTNKVQNDTTP